MFQLAMDMVKFINDEIIDLFHAHGFTAESAGTCISLLSLKGTNILEEILRCLFSCI